MTLTDEHIAEFQTLYRKHFGRDIGKDEALEKGTQLVRIVELVIGTKSIINEPKPDL